MSLFVHKETGEYVDMTAQDETSTVHFKTDGGEEKTLPSHVFFTEYRAGTGEDFAAYSKKDGGKKDGGKSEDKQPPS